MKMAKNIDGFLATLWPKYRVWGEFQRGVPLLSTVHLPPTQLFGVSVTPPMQSGGLFQTFQQVSGKRFYVPIILYNDNTWYKDSCQEDQILLISYEQETVYSQTF